VVQALVATIKMALMIAEAKEMIKQVQVIKENLGVLLMEKHDGYGGTKVYGLGGRRMNKLPSFEDDFNEDAKVAINIIVDKAGNVTSTAVNPVGTSTTNQKTRSVALRRA
jgi:hypothetical protein